MHGIVKNVTSVEYEIKFKFATLVISTGFSWRQTCATYRKNRLGNLFGQWSNRFYKSQQIILKGKRKLENGTAIFNNLEKETKEAHRSRDFKYCRDKKCCVKNLSRAQHNISQNKHTRIII